MNALLQLKFSKMMSSTGFIILTPPYPSMQMHVFKTHEQTHIQTNTQHTQEPTD